MTRRLIWLMIFAVAMAYVESAVVVYLRAIYYPQGFTFPLVLMPSDMVAIEIGREAATLVMLLGVAMLAAVDRWDRILTFCIAFGVWDIAYYVWLWVFLRWPPSLLTWDVLFLIPVPWVGPVVAPVIVSVVMIVGSLVLMRRRAGGRRAGRPAVSRSAFRPRYRLWCLRAACSCLRPSCWIFRRWCGRCSQRRFAGGCSGRGWGSRWWRWCWR